MMTKDTRSTCATGAPREFHVSRGVREACVLDASLFASSGNVVFADFRAARDFAHQLNENRPAEQAVSASDIYALGLIDEALHLVVARHRREHAPDLWSDAFELLGEEIGKGPLEELLQAFVEEFPPTPVFTGEVTAEEHLAGQTDGEDHRQVALEELVLLWLANRNPAFEPFRELFDEDCLRQTTAYGTAVRRLESFLAASLTSGPKVESLLDLLSAPVRAVRTSTESSEVSISWPRKTGRGSPPGRGLSSRRTIGSSPRPVSATPPTVTGCRSSCCWPRTCMCGWRS
jgi:hypothetical protein